MGVAIVDLLEKKDISVAELSGKTLAVDTHLWLYQFLTSIRQRDGALLTDEQGNVTSHLIGLVSRIVTMAKYNIKLFFVFDGAPPQLKQQILAERKKIKQEAAKKYEQATLEKDPELMRRYASMTTRLTDPMIQEAKELISAFGLPVVQAPSEAEAQASSMVKKGDAYAIATNDADALLFGAPRIIRNLNLVGKKKRNSKLAYETISPDIVSLTDTINELGLDQKQLIALSMLVGTDYNPKGIKGIGPKNAIKLVKEHGHDFENLFSAVKWGEHFDYSWKEVYALFENYESTDEYTLEWTSLNEQKVREILVDNHQFSSQRLDQQLKPLLTQKQAAAQKGLGDFFT